MIKSTSLLMFSVIASILLLGTISSENAFADEITITEDTFGTIVVEEGTRLILDGTTHTGKIVVKGGELLLIGGCTVDGKITSTSGSIHASHCVFTDNLNLKNSHFTMSESVISKNLISTDAVGVFIFASEVTGKVTITSQGTANVIIESSVIDKNLKLNNVNDVTMEEVEIRKDLRITNSADLFIEVIEVFGNTLIKNNDVSEIDSSTFHKNLKFVKNGDAFPHENTILGDMILLKNSQCHTFDNQVDGKIKIKGCLIDHSLD